METLKSMESQKNSDLKIYHRAIIIKNTMIQAYKRSCRPMAKIKDRKIICQTTVI